MIDDNYKKFSFASTGKLSHEVDQLVPFRQLNKRQHYLLVYCLIKRCRQKIIDLPAEIKAKYPTLNLDLMKYQSNNVYGLPGQLYLYGLY